MNARENKVKKFSHKIFKKIFLTIFFAISFLVFCENSYAIECNDQSDCGTGRIRSCSASGDVESLGADPTKSADMMFDLSNPVCQAIVVASYAAVKGSIEAMCSACGMGNPCTSITPSPIQDAGLVLRGVIKAATSSACQGPAISAGDIFGAEILALYSIYLIADSTFKGTSICGSHWRSPNPSENNISTADYKQTVEDFVKNNPNSGMSDQKYREWYYGGQEYTDSPNSGETCLDPTVPKISSTNSAGKVTSSFPAQKYYLTGTTAGNFNCDKYNLSLLNSTINPEATTDDYNKAYSCCKNRSQNYICIDYGNKSDPIHNGNTSFCKSGELCTIGTITFSAGQIETSDSRLICAQSYSLCPYNFTIGGGTKYCDYYQDGVQNSYGTYKYITPEDIAKATDPTNPTNDCNQKSEIRTANCLIDETKAGKCKNYCQYLTHCTVVGTSSYKYKSNLGSPYFSTACFNFVGDSRNTTSLNSNIIFGQQRHFSAPIAQCVKETLENVFYNRAGHSQCLDGEEYPKPDGTCGSGKYIQTHTDGFDFTYQKGNQVKSLSFFATLQNTLQGAVKMVLTLAIMFYGLRILIAHNMTEMKKSNIIMFAIKIGLVMYFATGDAWQTMFFEGVYNASTVFSDMVFHIESNLPDLKKDGCQFDAASIAQNPYPAGKSYLAIWDTLDCKIMRYLGFGPQASVANIASLIFASIFTGPIGIYFAIGLMFFGFLFIVLTIRALQIFLFSVMSVIIMVYISPIIIPTVLFPKTADIFKKWLTNLIGFCLQPMILFAYIGIFISVIDSTLIGSATFKGTAPHKDIVCNKVCKDVGGNVITGDTNCSQTGHAMVGGTCQDNIGNIISAADDPTCSASGHSLVGATCQDSSGNNVGGDPTCSQAGHSIVDPNTDSIACMINIDNYGRIPFLETIGISLPALYDFFASNVKQKIMTIMKAAFIVYIMSQFMDQISEITSQLIGSSTIKGAWANSISTSGMMSSAAGMANGFISRVRRGGMNAGESAFDTISKGLQEGAGKAGAAASASLSESPDNKTGSDSGGGGESGGDEGGDNSSGGDSGGGSSEGGDGGAENQSGN